MVTLQPPIETERQKKKMCIISTAIIIALLAAHAATTPSLFRPRIVLVTGTIMAPGVVLTKMTFTNPECGTKNQTDFPVEGTSGTYAIFLANGYSYNVSIAWKNNGGALVETAVGTLVLETPKKTLVQDWAFQP